MQFLSFVVILSCAPDTMAHRHAGSRPATPSDGLSPGKPEAAKPTMPQSSVTFTDGRLTVQIQNRPLEWVLEEISRQSRVAIVRAAGVGGDRVPLALQGLPLDETLRQILTDHDAFFFYSVEKEAPALLRAGWVYPRGRGRGLAPVPPEEWASTRELCNEATANPDPAARARAVEILVERSGDQAMDVAGAALRDRDADVRTRTLFGALRTGLPIPADRLAQLALADPSPNVRFLALEALPTDPKARTTVDVAGIVIHALNDPSPHVRIKAQEILKPREPEPGARGRPSRLRVGGSRAGSVRRKASPASPKARDPPRGAPLP